ncbi:MAG: hypothetical protein KAI95_17290 [Bacteroidales bacterium]|nr:hypothetical protein [Bacteroidales bacterium]
MKDITISGKRIRTELKWLLGCFVAAIIFNVYAIIRYQTSWAEFFTSLHVLVLLSLVFYLLLLFFRGLISLIMRFSTRKRKT